MALKTLMLAILMAVTANSTKPDKRSAVPWDLVGSSGWNTDTDRIPATVVINENGKAVGSWSTDTNSDVAGALAAAKSAAAAVMLAQQHVSAANHAALEQQSVVSAKQAAAARAAHKSEEAARRARAQALEAAQAAVHAQAQLAAAKARAAAAQKIAAARESAAAKAIESAAHSQAARLQNAGRAFSLFQFPMSPLATPSGLYEAVDILTPPLHDIESLKWSVLQSSGAAGAAGAAQHAATAAAAALRPDASAEWLPASRWQPYSPSAWIW